MSPNPAGGRNFRMGERYRLIVNDDGGRAAAGTRHLAAVGRSPLLGLRPTRRRRCPEARPAHLHRASAPPQPGCGGGDHPRIRRVGRALLARAGSAPVGWAGAEPVGGVPLLRSGTTPRALILNYRC